MAVSKTAKHEDLQTNAGSPDDSFGLPVFLIFVDIIFFILKWNGIIDP